MDSGRAGTPRRGDLALTEPPGVVRAGPLSEAEHARAPACAQRETVTGTAATREPPLRLGGGQSTPRL